MKRFKQLNPSQRLTIILIVLITLWVLSGIFSKPSGSVGDSPASSTASLIPNRISIMESTASMHQRYATLYGELRPSRDVNLSAQTSGEIVEIVAQEGQEVRQGDVIVRIDEQDRQERLSATVALVRQRQQEYDAALKLSRKGFESRISLSRAKAELGQAQAELKRLRLDADFTNIRAPFDGVVEAINVDPGDFGGVGVFGVEGSIARIVDMDPMLAVGAISQKDRMQVDRQGIATITLQDGRNYEGNITYLASVADETTRSFPVEVSLPNPDMTLKAGLSAAIRIPLEQVRAHYIPASILSLADDGGLRVKVLNAQQRVASLAVTILSEDEKGIWVAGLPDKVTLITRGHVYVSDGMEITVDMLGAEEGQAQ